MNARCSTPDTICLQCGDRGFTNAFVYCVKCLNVAVHRYCLDVVPNTVDEFVHWVCDLCDHSTSAPSSSTAPSSTPVASGSLQPAPTPTPLDSAGEAAAPARDDRGSTQVLEHNLDGNFGGHNMSFEDINVQNVERAQKLAWKRSEVRFLSPKIIMWYRWRIFDQIGKTLKAVGQAPLVERFISGCFRRLFWWQPGNSPSRALHVLFSYETKSPNPDELWFDVHGTFFYFGARHYALISGLCFGYSNFDPRRGPHDLSGVGVYHRVAGGRPIQLRLLKSNFVALNLYKGEYSEKSDDYLKVANILALYCFYLGYDDSRKVEDWAWFLVDDLAAWNKFPWGAYSYGALMHYAARIPRTVQETGKQYHIYGPMWALQVWSFETIPGLGYAVGSFSQSSVIPRAVKWRFRAPGAEVDFGRIFGEEFACYDIIVDALEAEQDYWLSITGNGDLFGVRFFTAENPIHPLRVQDGKPVLFRKATKLIKNTSRSRSKNTSTEIEEDEEVDRQTEMRTRDKGKSVATGSSSRLPERGARLSVEQYQQLRSDFCEDMHNEIASYVVPTIMKDMKSLMKSFFHSSKSKSRGSRDG